MIIPSTASHVNFPVIKRANGKYCWDVAGNKYLDFNGANLTVILGHKRFKFKNPPHFTGESYLEDEVSKELSKLTGTKYFRYFKNGSDAVNCAIRLSRHIVKNPNELVCFAGYAGSNDCYARTINPNGIPDQNSQQKLKYGHIVVYESRYYSHVNQVPMLQHKIKICDDLKSGINGLYENIDADFHLYGKSLANGYPIAVLTGRNDYMEKINEIYYSTTYGGENTGLEAVQQTLKEFNRDKWLKLKKYADSKLPAWQSLTKEQIMEFRKRGILNNGYWQIMQIHTKQDIDRLAEAYIKIC